MTSPHKYSLGMVHVSQVRVGRSAKTTAALLQSAFLEQQPELSMGKESIAGSKFYWSSSGECDRNPLCIINNETAVK